MKDVVTESSSFYSGSRIDGTRVCLDVEAPRVPILGNSGMGAPSVGYGELEGRVGLLLGL